VAELIWCLTGQLIRGIDGFCPGWERVPIRTGLFVWLNL